jgi:hypothetical protein
MILITAALGIWLVAAQNPTEPESRNGENAGLIADAVDWYSTWSRAAHPAGATIQTCRGELRTNLYRFRCDPLSAVVDVETDGAGHCVIVSMRPAISADDGLRVQTLENLIPSNVPRRKGAAPQDCGELPVKGGAFELKVTPHVRLANDALLNSARSAAIHYDTQGGDDFCLLRFPKAKTGDPFFHVYEECQGALTAVWEFTINRGQVADFPHWTYTRRKGDLPRGIDWRRNSADLWFAISKPEERKDSKR